MAAKKTRKQKPEIIDRLSMWDWETLVASWRYFEYGMTASSAGFPHDIVSRFWGQGNRYADNVRDTIANQFVNMDHRSKGERDWHDKGMNVDRRAWTAFCRFCEAWLNGFAQIAVKRVDGKIERVDAFHTDFEDRWYVKSIYIDHGESWMIPKDSIVDAPDIGTMSKKKATSVNKKPTEEQADEEFRKKYHQRYAERCCGSCKYGIPEYEGAVSCHHPERVFWDNLFKKMEHGDHNSSSDEVCDAWEKP